MASPASLTATLNDPARLAALQAALLLDSVAEPEFDRLTRLAKRVLDVPTALISLVDGRRQFFKSCIGLNGWPAEQRGTPLSHSFCQYVVHSGVPLAIDDAREDALVRENLATTELDVVAYLGVPLRSRDGHVLGTICAVDTIVRRWNDEDIAAMSDLAEGVMTEIVLGEEVRALRAAETALADAAEAAVSAAEAKARFLAGMSHELRTPLNGILGILDLLDGGEPHHRDLLRTARSSGAELLRIVNDVLDFSKLEAGKLRLDPHPFALDELVEDTCHLLAGDAHAKGLELVTWIDPRLPQALHGDGGRLRQVLTNLVANAVKFTATGEVVVRAEAATGDHVRFSVTDSGIGIAPDRLPALFDPFEQAELSTTRHYGGTGLGLTITRELVELMGGTLDAESEPGHGTTFAFTLPLTPAEDGRAAPPPFSDAPRVLVAVTHAASRAAVADYLGAHGALCELATSADEAAWLLSGDASFALVIADPAIAPVCAVPTLVLRPAGETGPDELPTPVRRAQLITAATRRLRTTATAAPATVLVADDNEINRRVITAMLGRRGVAAEAVADGAQAVQAVQNGEFVAVLMDCEMPIADGFSATERIRAAGHRIPIIAMTGHVLDEDRARCRRAGMDDHLAKPIDAHSLDAILERWIYGSRSNQQSC
ncbi:ATP-binding protein [Solirubrobacter phytolaccae]|uniref:histidine kinase n=1 Tax=Solirubrobacter phytolaccae TaxID=1404360 RepID=A0A9X3S9S2_9ACTN|nr:ATP-binding protein [Solirubrobacter phytolaccae]MDA0182913.1 ATP-binding protein [Solirubrobacter phytolaccae]